MRSYKICHLPKATPFRCLTRKEAQLMLTNPRDAFRGQSRSPNIVSFHMLGILNTFLLCNSNFDFAVFLIFDVKKCLDLEIRVRGHSRSLKVVLFDRLHMVFYWCYIETLSRRCTVFEIFDFKYATTLKNGLGPVKVIVNVTVR